MGSQVIDKAVLNDFAQESIYLVRDGTSLLEEIEGLPLKATQLGEFSSQIDRVMTQAKSLSAIDPSHRTLAWIADYCAICKSVGLQGSQITENDQLYNVVVAFLLDALEMITVLLENLDGSVEEAKKKFSLMFLDRLKWISFQYEELARKRNTGPALGQNEIDRLLRKLGI